MNSFIHVYNHSKITNIDNNDFFIKMKGKKEKKIYDHAQYKCIKSNGILKIDKIN